MGLSERAGYPDDFANVVVELTGRWPYQFANFYDLELATKVPADVLRSWISNGVPAWVHPMLLRAKSKAVEETYDVLDGDLCIDVSDDVKRGLFRYSSDLLSCADYLID